ncbi:cytochrome P450 [Annulohypoxylon maeteangense]|uniref:cytochrome P450 n=1 Tax=Annulohypoxylon maeteangense TaxID=1927788 RepID=UPI00200774C2|nr:cytochrome P450 [Annulohypoxylon maeteangense]KAI0886853.1 cytochrome P450 [Annulohypoxylon maeteangense]
MESPWLVLNAFGGVLLTIAIVRVIAFVSELWNHRVLVKNLEKMGKPMSAHSSLLGHLLAAKTASDELPPGAHSSYILDRMARKLDGKYGPPAYYFDSYPVSTPMLIVRDPFIANQVTGHSWTSAQKPPTLTEWFAPISGKGGINLFTQNDQEWKHDHNLFLPFFNNSNLDATMPIIIEQMLIFRDILRKKVEAGGLFRLEPLALSLMKDIIGRVVFNAELGNQTAGSHPLSEAMLRQLDLKFGANNVMDNLGQLNPFRAFRIWNNGRILNRNIYTQMAKRTDAFREAKARQEQSSFNSVLDQALETYYSEPNHKLSDPLDADFMDILCAQLRMFFFAGYDSTSSTMVSCCYMIWTHPTVLSKLRAEHDEVFGTNIAACPSMITENPSILNSLPYTLAVIKEALRLFPPANGIRMGCKDLVLKDRDGNEYPTEGCGVQINHLSIQRNPACWPRPLEFLPERFMVGPDHELYPEKGSWRVFEHGIRNCTGQAFVMKEVKAFLALVCREFNFQECYDEVYAGEKIDLVNVDNEKAYLIEHGAAHPRGEFPCKASFSGYVPGETR